MKRKYKDPFLIAEIGINHNGSLELAKKLVDLAVKYNFDAIKFQKRDPDVCVPESEKNKIRNTPWGAITYLEYKKKIELNKTQINQLIKYCKKKIIIFASCFDINSLRNIKRFKFKFNKIPSAMITNIEFLNAVAAEKKHTFISTGMCTMSDVEKAVKIFKNYKCKFTLLHCVSLYPCPEKNLNLKMIQKYKKKFNCDVGYSGHESAVVPSIYAYFLGANTIERHITLDRSMWGTDQAASLSGQGMELLSAVLKKNKEILGSGQKKMITEEKNMLNKFKYWK